MSITPSPAPTEIIFNEENSYFKTDLFPLGETLEEDGEKKYTDGTAIQREIEGVKFEFTVMNPLIAAGNPLIAAGSDEANKAYIDSLHLTGVEIENKSERVFRLEYGEEDYQWTEEGAESPEVIVLPEKEHGLVDFTEDMNRNKAVMVVKITKEKEAPKYIQIGVNFFSEEFTDDSGKFPVGWYVQFWGSELKSYKVY